jgi:hypothetical protein
LWTRCEPATQSAERHRVRILPTLLLQWKIASLGVPVALVYLGFIAADEMRGRKLIGNGEEWELIVRDYVRGIVPDRVWDKPMDVAGTPVRAFIQSRRIDIPHP